MHLVRVTLKTPDGPRSRVGLRDGTAVRPLPYPTMAAALADPVAELRARCRAAAGAEPLTGVTGSLPPIDGRTEVWAAGVTYRRSRQARMEESDTADVYERVYRAERPELFLKSVAWRVVTDGDRIGVRTDSPLTVPEPELAVVANRFGDIVGYTVCDDVSSRSIEGENPLYLPQAKIYAGACALATGIRPVWELPDASDLAVRCRIERAGAVVWAAETSTAELHRRPEDLLTWLFRHDHHPDGVVLSTGTGLVPELDVTLAEGDEVEIEIRGVGTLTNVVAVGSAPFAELAARA